MSRPEVLAVVDGFLALVMDAVANGERVELRRFGVWKPTMRKGRTLKTPDGRHDVQIPDRPRLVFVPAAEFYTRITEKHTEVTD